MLLAGCSKESQEALPLQSSSKQAGKGAYRVAIGKAKTYDRALIDRQISEMLDNLGGMSQVVKPGDVVAIKPNLTGGVNAGSIPGYTPVESFITHPEVTRALVKQVKDAGAKEIYIVESVYEWASYKEWGYETIAQDLGVKLIDLNDVKPFDKHMETAVSNSAIYSSLLFNQILNNVNVFMSVAKMKNHYNAGVTHSMKNLVGLVPYAFYEMSKGDGYRSAMHGKAEETGHRLPRVIVDLNKARPIHFALIDGVMTTEAGEGPWITTMSPIQPGVLFAGINPVATDAVATACQGYDPTSDYPDGPYVRGESHLNLATAAGLGSNRLDEIEVVGAKIDDVKVQFQPAS
jgi:uncharacterized protein (DUF362 family)